MSVCKAHASLKPLMKQLRAEEAPVSCSEPDLIPPDPAATYPCSGSDGGGERVMSSTQVDVKSYPTFSISPVFCC